MAEKKQELEKRLQDVTGQLGSAKKQNKKGKGVYLLFEIKNLFRIQILYLLIKCTFKLNKQY